jgi:heme a synthase
MVNKTLFRIATLAALLAFFVIMLGAYTRLTDAGLGCPDWPGCYAQMTVPDTPAEIARATVSFPGSIVQSTKAWTEMIHRYLAGTLGLLVFGLAFLGFRKRKDYNISVVLPVVLATLVVFQAALGMWTVTLKLLPVVVMGHLLGGVTLFCLIWWLRLRAQVPGRTYLTMRTKKQMRPWAVLGLAICFCQIALGGWVSANYAGLACIGFPACNGVLFPHLNFAHAFNILAPIGADYQGGVLSNATRVTIQMVHRFGAVVTGFYVAAYALCLITSKNTRAMRNLGIISLLLVSVQFILGVINVTQLLPLPVAVAHNGVAALLLITLLTIVYRFFERGERI